MGDITKNISRHELACHCGCGFDTMDVETIVVLQETCDHFAEVLDVPRVRLNLHSAARCLTYNRKPEAEGGPGSSDGSAHPLARAIDFSIDGVSPSDVYAYLEMRFPGRYGIGKYKTFTHLDTKTGPGRWW